MTTNFNGRNVQLLSVLKKANITQILLQCEWLLRMGFVPGSLVKAVPTIDGGIDFILCNDNIASYSNLLHETQTCGGKLIVVGQRSKGRNSVIQLTLGQKLQVGLWAYGCPLIVVYEHGVIQVRKLPGERYHTIGGTYDSSLDKTVTVLKLQSNWLVDFGFVPNALVTVTAGKENIAVKLWDNGAQRYGEIVKYARTNNAKLIQIGTLKHPLNTPHIAIKGAFVENAGFAAGDIVSVEASHGFLQLQKLTLVGLGF